MTAEFICNLLISVVLTAVFYGAGPLLLIALWKGKTLRLGYLQALCVGYTVVVWIIFQVLTYDGNGVQIVPAIFWGFIFYRFAKSRLTIQPQEKVAHQRNPADDTSREDSSETFVSERDYQRAMRIISLSVHSKEMRELAQAMGKTPAETMAYFEGVVRAYNSARYKKK